MALLLPSLSLLLLMSALLNTVYGDRGSTSGYKHGLFSSYNALPALEPSKSFPLGGRAQSQRVKMPKRQADHKPECGVMDSTTRMQRAAQYTNSGSSHVIRSVRWKNTLNWRCLKYPYVIRGSETKATPMETGRTMDERFLTEYFTWYRKQAVAFKKTSNIYELWAKFSICFQAAF
jgi:hypothetical protein